MTSNGYTNGTADADDGVPKSTATWPHFGTDATHHGSDPDTWNFAPIVPPISLSTTFKQNSPGVYEKYDYSRAGNPTRTAFEECVAKLEGGKHCIATSSGLAATMLIVNMLKSGDHILTCDDIYGGTNRYFNKVVKKFGVEIDMVDPTNLKAVQAGIKPNTKVVWLETPTNPTLKICDIAAVVDIVAKCRGTQTDNPRPLVLVDNTFASPYFQRPLSLGADISLSSVTKYINGHTDVCMGVLITSDDAIAKELHFLLMAVGPAPSPFDCYLALRGCRTLHLRMRKHEENGLAIARWLEKQKHVTKTIHPGLPSHPQHELAMRQMKGFSGMISFIIDGGKEEASLFLSSLKIFSLAESLGGYDSLAELPSVMTHASVPAEQRAIIGITDSLIRLSCGIEEAEDLVADLAQAFKIVYKD